jgi:hypothetical protein
LAIARSTTGWLRRPFPEPRHQGKSDAFVLRVVQSAGHEIEIVDDQPYSFGELEKRKVEVHDALVSLGFSQVSTGVNITGRGAIVSLVLRTPGVTDIPDEIVAAVPSALRASVSVVVTDTPFVEEDRAFGGMRTRATATGFICTSGFTVRHQATGVFGVTDAGHCGGMNRIVDPATGTQQPMTFKTEHLGLWGDVEWFTHSQVAEALFYASAATIRGVLYLEPRAGISLNEPVCLYGRTSNVQNCTARVDDVSTRCTNANITYDNMVLMDKDIGAGGDSGGPWFYGNRAFGGHHGPCGGVPAPSRDSFSIADLFDEALNVKVVIYE